MGLIRRVFALAPALLSLAGGGAHAAAHLTLKEVVQTVVLTNPEVLAKWHAFKSAIGDVDVARAGFFPRIDLTTGAGQETLRQPGAADRDFSRSGHTLTLNQMLYDGFTTSNDVKRLNKARLSRYFELVDAAEAAALEGSRAYFDVIRYRQLMVLAENNYVDHRYSYELLLRRAQTGAGRRVDVEHAASRLALAELNLNTEAANLHDVTARFLRLTGHPPPPVMFAPARMEREYPASEPEALKLAFRQNPALRSAVENIEAARHDLDMRRGAFHPKLDLRLRNESSGNYLGSGGTRRNDVAEVLLSFNLFNGGADVARQTVFAERVNMALDLRDKACVDIRQTLSIAYNDVERLKAQQANIALQVGAIERTREAYRAQFNIGQRSLLDLLDTENELLTARRTAVNADVDLALALLRTQAGLGRLLEHLGLKRIDDQERPDPAEFATVVDAEICPPEAPPSYLVKLDHLTARALAQLEASTASNPPLGNSSVPAVPATAVASPAALLAERVKAWAAAWSGKDWEAYAAFYAPAFMPADGGSRGAWARKRQQRVTRPGPVVVEVGPISVKEVSLDSQLTQFEQHYRSDGYGDRSAKELLWVNVGGIWLIARETAQPVAAGSSPPGRAVR